MENLNKAAITNGVIIGLISLAIQILAYYTAPELLGKFYFGIIVMIISLILYIIFTLDLRNKIGGFWTFKEALKGIFLMAVIAGLITTIINYIFYTLIEPGAFERISGYVSSGLNETYEKLGMNQEQIDKATEEALKQMKSQYNPTFMDLLKTFGIGIIIQFVMSLIFAAIFKKEPPVFASVNDEE